MIPKNPPVLKYGVAPKLDPRNVDPLYPYSNGFNFEMRPTLFHMWMEIKKNRVFKPIFRKPPIDRLIWAEIKWTAKRTTSWIVQTVGPMEEGKSWLNISVAHFLRDYYLIFLKEYTWVDNNGVEHIKLIVPRIYVTFDYRETLAILNNPSKAREALIPVKSVYWPKELGLDIFDITKRRINRYDDYEVLPGPGDIIVQDERPRLHGLGAKTTVDNLNNIIETSRKKQINFFFASPVKIPDLSIHNNMFEMMGRDFERFYSRFVVYDQLTNPLGIVHWPVYPDWQFFEIYEKRKDEQIDRRLAGGGSVSGVDLRQIKEDVKKVVKFMEEMNITPDTKSSIKFVAQLALPAAPVSYIEMVVEYLYQLIKAGMDVGEIQHMSTTEEGIDVEEKAEAEKTAEIVVSASSEGAIDESSEEQEEEEQEEYMQLDKFNVEEVYYHILTNEPLVKPQNVSWQVVQLAYFYKVVEGMRTDDVIKKLKEEIGETLSSKTIHEYIRQMQNRQGYFAQIETSLYTKLGFAYEKWVQEHYWKKHPQVEKVESYKDTGKSHQSTPDLILTLKDGRKVAVAIKVRNTLDTTQPIKFKKRDKWIPEWQAYLDGEVDLVVLDVWNVAEERAYRKIVKPIELSKRTSVRFDIQIDEDGVPVEVGEHVTFDIH